MIKKRRNFAERRSDSGLGDMERKRKQRKEFLTRERSVILVLLRWRLLRL